MGIKLDVTISPIPPIPDDTPKADLALATPGIVLPSRLGPLALLAGKWVGKGFNQIWRPFHSTVSPSQDRFLELNFTHETLEFTEIDGPIPNRGLLQADINLFGLTYLQQVSDAHVLGPNGKPAGIHIEPGIWISVPLTTNPADPKTVARLANIPHGTSLVAQGKATPLSNAPEIPNTDIVPFQIGNPTNKINFPEQNLSIPTSFRSPPANIPGITQAMVDNPNSILQSALAHLTVTATTVLHVSTAIEVGQPPTSGGGTSNIAFLDGAANSPNARASKMEAIFWIMTTKDALGKVGHVLQYTQRVLLDFNTLSWPHVSVATLIKQ